MWVFVGLFTNQAASFCFNCSLVQIGSCSLLTLLCVQGSFSSKVGSTGCSSCRSNQFCPIGASAPLSVVPAAVTSYQDPTDNDQVSQSTNASNFRVSLGIAAAVIAGAILAAALLVACFCSPEHIKRVDLLHRVRAVPVPPTAPGGVMTMFLLLGILLAIAYSVYDFEYTSYQTASLSAKSSSYVPRADGVPFSVQATFIGCSVSDCGGSVSSSGFSAGYVCAVDVCND